MSAFTSRPLSDRTWLRPDSARVRSRFDTAWSSTKSLLMREVEYLDGKALVVERDFREEDFRLDGEIRSGRKAQTPAVVVAFESKIHGPVQFQCDKFFAGWYGPTLDSWQENVRAIALTMENLRACDRYGAVDTGQQYTGFKALGAGTGIGLSSGMTASDAIVVLCAAADFGTPDSNTDSVNEALVKQAKINSHPDKNDGERTMWNDVEQAERVLRRAGKVF